MPKTQTEMKLESAWAMFMSLNAKQPYIRRSQVIEFLANSVRRDQREVAIKAADQFMKQARKDMMLVKSGHVHWRFVGVTRKLIDGRPVAETAMTTLEITSRVPSKWLSVDLETGDVWQGNEAGKWVRASPENVSTLKLLAGKIVE
ncbi:hypothetical protein G3O06_05430 [Burkholderia sp. Ac-20345]|uniref:hypothetical protein n=1 Tax=Burkholderia sp. Ac-20345 TaxID=2703891 RepID=UPI00197B24C4|nr:hypothetical protein [Burkholderia sp. Ac-20345]MBN3777011.1 hypothetical protein [Burkholderia sp. Ac-20345]